MRRRRPDGRGSSPRRPARLLDLLGVLDAELTGSLDSTLLTLGFRDLAAGELFQQLGDGGAAVVGEDP
ncbi:hypothetical protein OOK13_29300 [Streptomyces sp. NBC_00378]|uniref:hypothetical protein n=1 Tax=unclassified Streptomyces TaxID=2593676 RepID=UPI002258C1C7|nr:MULTISPECIES: hypothetical protein [unclassified Streptomyces]MCX5112501.1 hypothetical protein [Streptomyces sp. NBC_00378]